MSLASAKYVYFEMDGDDSINDPEVYAAKTK